MDQDSLRRLIAVFWWGIAVLILITYAQEAASPIIAEWSQPDGFTWSVGFHLLRAVVLIIMIVALFSIGALMIPILFQAPPESTGTKLPEEGFAFPLSATPLIGMWLIVISILLIVGLIQSLFPGSFVTWHIRGLIIEGNAKPNSEMQYLLVAMFAAGIGSMITTILGYLLHASELRDFKMSFVPWYFARPLIGVLVGIVFYFVLKGGIIVTVGESEAGKLNVYGIAGQAALVGLFSKNAVEKLRDIFETMFTSEAGGERALLEKLKLADDDLKEKVMKALDKWNRR
jgi:hypothetical protein